MPFDRDGGAEIATGEHARIVKRAVLGQVVLAIHMRDTPVLKRESSIINASIHDPRRTDDEGGAVLGVAGELGDDNREYCPKIQAVT